MKRTILAAVITALCAVASSPAQAATIKPALAPLVDSSGVDSGCTLQVFGGWAPPPTQGPFVDATGYLKVVSTLHCSHHWRAHKISVGWQPVIGDRRGTAYTRAAAGGSMSNTIVPSPEPFQTSTYATFNPCLSKRDGFVHDPGTSTLGWLLPLGDNGVIYRGTAKVNEYRGDLRPYKATAEKLVTVTCTSARNAYR